MQMDIFLSLILILALIIVLLAIVFRPKAKPAISNNLPIGYKVLLEEKVPFYQQLNESRKKEFEERIGLFLARIKISGIVAGAIINHYPKS